MPDLAPPPAPKQSFVDIMKANADNTPAPGTPAPAAPAATTTVVTPPIAPPKELPDKVVQKVEIAPPTVDPDEEIISGKRSPKSDDFKRIKSVAETARKEATEVKSKLSEYEKELAELRKRPVANADEIKALVSERDEFKGKWNNVAAQFDPAFNQKYSERIAAAIAPLKDMGIASEKHDKIVEVLQMPESRFKMEQLKALTEDLDPVVVSEITAANREVRGISRARQIELSNSEKILTEAATARLKQQQEAQERRAKTFEEVLAEAQVEGDKGNPLFQLRKGDDEATKEWNAGVRERQSVARAIYDGKVTGPELARQMLWASAAPGFLAELKTTKAALAERDATIARLTSASPDLNGGGGKGPDSKGGFLEKMLEGRK